MKLSQFFIRWGLRSFMAVYAVLMSIAKWIGSRKQELKRENYVILLTGTFYSDNWIMSHVQPLAISQRTSVVYMVASSPLPPMKKVKAIYPPSWLTNLIGKVPARLLTFFWTGVRIRPDFVGGFHILANGLVAALLGRMIGARSIYFCGGGPREVIGGGYLGNRVFGKLKTEDKFIERQLLKAVSAFDVVIGMGNNTIDFFKSNGIKTNYYVVSGGKDENVFYPSLTTADYDLILVARLTEVKRVDIFLKAVKIVSQSIPDVSAIIVGDGPLRSALEALSNELGLGSKVRFVGHQTEVGNWLRKAKICVLTSESEGLSLALIEAMMCGLPAIVSKVGDIDELVEDSINGFLVSDLTPEGFASRFIELMTNNELMTQFSEAALKSTEKYKLSNASCLWDDILSNNTEIRINESVIITQEKSVIEK